MRTEAVTCVICQAEDRACLDNLTRPHEHFLQMRVNGLVTVLVSDANMDAIIMPARLIMDPEYFPGGDAKDFAPCRSFDVNAIMPGRPNCA